MALMIDLGDLLKHEILDLYSAEEQIIDALPKMIEKATNAELKKALRDHLKVTEQQKSRLDDIKGLMGEGPEGTGPEGKKGFFSKLFGGAEKCKGTEGLIKEGEKMMGEDMTPEVMDAAIIGAAQKIEHYEISGYGTAVAYARELGLSKVAAMLQQTLEEEYAADDSLTNLAVGKLNIKAENATSPKSNSNTGSGRGSSSKRGPSKTGPVSKRNVAKSTSSKGASKSNTSKNTTSSGKRSAGKFVGGSSGKNRVKRAAKGSSKSGKSKSSAKR